MVWRCQVKKNREAEPSKAKPVDHHHLHHIAEVEANVKALRAARNSKISHSLSAKHSREERKVEVSKEKAHTEHKHHKRDESLLEISDKSLAQDKLRQQAHAHAHARAKASQMAALMGGFTKHGRGRGGYQGWGIYRAK